MAFTTKTDFYLTIFDVNVSFHIGFKLIHYQKDVLDVLYPANVAFYKSHMSENDAATPRCVIKTTTTNLSSLSLRLYLPFSLWLSPFLFHFPLLYISTREWSLCTSFAGQKYYLSPKCWSSTCCVSTSFPVAVLTQQLVKILFEPFSEK